jgi:hypothetical protein
MSRIEMHNAFSILQLQYSILNTFMGHRTECSTTSIATCTPCGHCKPNTRNFSERQRKEYVKRDMVEKCRIKLNVHLFQDCTYDAIDSRVIFLCIFLRSSTAKCYDTAILKVSPSPLYISPDSELVMQFQRRFAMFVCMYILLWRI